MIESKRNRLTRTGLLYLVLTVGAIVMVFPLLWTVSTSLKTQESVTVREIQLIPDSIAWTNYIEAFDVLPIVQLFRNTLIVVGASLFGGLVTSSLVGYAFARIPFPGRDKLFLVLLATSILPYIVQIVPLFVIFDRLGWINTFLPLVVPRLLGHNPFYIFLYRQFFRGLPSETFDAARIDGCSEFRLWWQITLPNSKAVLAAVGIFSFQFAWNDFLNPLIYVGGNKSLWTLSLGLSSLRDPIGSPTPLNLVMVVAVFMIVPMMLIFAFGQRYLIQGIATTGLKG